MNYDQLPFPMDCLYADPDRKVVVVCVASTFVKYLNSLILDTEGCLFWFRPMMSWDCTMALDAHSSILLV